jgi:hypothetical protein
MSSNIYDNDCSIIKQPVTIDEFRKEIDLLKEEITNLKKAKNNFIIDLVDFDKEDKEIEEKNKELLLYLKSLIETEDFKNNRNIEIKYESNKTVYNNIYDISKQWIITKRNKPLLFDYLRRRNLFLIVKGEHNNGFGFDPHYDHKVYFFLLHINEYDYTKLNYQTLDNLESHTKLTDTLKFINLGHNKLI